VVHTTVLVIEWFQVGKAL